MEATRIVIAHRLSTIINAEPHLLPAGGQIVEMGSYEELMKLERDVRRSSPSARWRERLRSPRDGPPTRFARSVAAERRLDAGIVEELLAYNTKPFPPEAAAARPAFPLPDEAHVDAWRGYEPRARAATSSPR